MTETEQAHALLNRLLNHFEPHPDFVCFSSDLDFTYKDQNLTLTLAVSTKPICAACGNIVGSDACEAAFDADILKANKEDL